MKIERLDEAIKNLEGEEMKVDAASGRMLTHRRAVCTALLSPDESDRAGEKKYDAFTLCMKVHNGNGSVDLTAEEVAQIKAAIRRVYFPIVVGRVFDWLEPKEAKA